MEVGKESRMDGVNERERNRDTGEEGGEWDGWRDWTL